MLGLLKSKRLFVATLLETTGAGQWQYKDFQCFCRPLGDLEEVDVGTVEIETPLWQLYSGIDVITDAIYQSTPFLFTNIFSHSSKHYKPFGFVYSCFFLSKTSAFPL